MSSVKPTNNTPLITTGARPDPLVDRTQVVISVTDPRLAADIRELSEAPGYLLADANGCVDLVEYGDKIPLKFAQTTDEKIVFLETQKSADDKFTKHIKTADDAGLIPGDQFLRELLQADITELEKKPGFLAVLKNRKKDALPLLELSKRDAQGLLCQEEADEYKQLLTTLYKHEIASYLDKAPLDRVADDYIERIRRILRTNARIVDENSLPRNLSGAWQAEASLGQGRLKKLSMATTGLAATLLVLGVTAKVLTDSNQDQEAVISELGKETTAKDHSLRGFRGESVFDKGFHSIPVSQEKIEERLKNNEEGRHLNKLINEVLEQSKADKDFYGSTTRILVSIPMKRPEEKIYAMQYDDLLHIAIPQKLLREMFTYIKTNHDTTIEKEVKFLVSKYLKKEKQ